MTKLFNIKIPRLLCIAALIHFLLYLTAYGTTFDIQIHDTYIVNNTIMTGLICNIIVLLAAGAYWLMRSKMKRSWFTRLHAASLMALPVFLFIAIHLHWKSIGTFDIDLHNDIALALLILAFLMLLNIPLLVFNSIWILLLRRKDRDIRTS